MPSSPYPSVAPKYHSPIYMCFLAIMHGYRRITRIMDTIVGVAKIDLKLSMFLWYGTVL